MYPLEINYKITLAYRKHGHTIQNWICNTDL